LNKGVEAMLLMANTHIRHLPIIKNKQVVGMVTAADLSECTICSDLANDPATTQAYSIGGSPNSASACLSNCWLIPEPKALMYASIFFDLKCIYGESHLLDDLIVGAYKADPNGNESGKSYVIFGKIDTDARLDLHRLI
jgi:signal-transduction protein with cAMP-binding, CBS, and nucleotidyltransferase domain